MTDTIKLLREALTRAQIKLHTYASAHANNSNYGKDADKEYWKTIKPMIEQALAATEAVVPSVTEPTGDFSTALVQILGLKALMGDKMSFHDVAKMFYERGLHDAAPQPQAGDVHHHPDNDADNWAVKNIIDAAKKRYTHHCNPPTPKDE